MPDFVKIQAPTVSINALPRMGCAPLTHRFTATVNSVDPVVSYEWDFGNGNTSNLSSPTQTFAAGAYDIQLVITTAGGCTDTVKVIRGIVASIKPAANFTATPRDACAFTSINFSDLSTGTVTSWQWLFGDGGSSTLQNPTYEYQDTGYFDVTLIVCNEGCCDTLKFENYIHINPPIAAYDVAFDCAKPFERVFTDQSVGADEWLWNFGDGNTATTASPTHTYTATGAYNVNLFVKNNTTGCTSTKNITVTIVDEKAAFTASDTIVCKYEPIIFSPAGTMPNSNITTYEWTYGDGNAGNTAPASHAYQQAGVYTVQLIITDILGCKDTLAKNLHIRVDGPTAAFTPGITSTCLLSAVPFTDNSTTDGLHPIQTWIWNYGDGTTDTLTAPPFVHNYAAPGSYGVSLKVIDNSGCADSTAQNSTILISKPLAAFSSIDTLTCPTKLVKFINRARLNLYLEFW
jgi:PKD repeat protein